jgi:DNA invertase Pin-like site-specific DNA recombinase
MTKCVSYLRVSGQSQIDGDGFPRQRERILAYAQANGYEIIQEFIEEGITGKMELENRPALAACLERVENNGVKVVLVESADRLARDLMVSELIIRQFQKAGVKVISAQAGVDLTEGDNLNPTSKLIRQILGAVAEWDRSVVVLKLKAARDRKKASTGRCTGRKPYGYMSGGPKKSEIPNPSEFPTLQLIQDMRSTKNYVEIANTLNSLNINTRYGKPWLASSIRKILKHSPAA